MWSSIDHYNTITLVVMIVFIALLRLAAERMALASQLSVNQVPGVEPGLFGEAVPFVERAASGADADTGREAVAHAARATAGLSQDSPPEEISQVTTGAFVGSTIGDAVARSLSQAMDDSSTGSARGREVVDELLAACVLILTLTPSFRCFSHCSLHLLNATAAAVFV